MGSTKTTKDKSENIKLSATKVGGGDDLKDDQNGPEEKSLLATRRLSSGPGGSPKSKSSDTSKAPGVFGVLQEYGADVTKEKKAPASALLGGANLAMEYNKEELRRAKEFIRAEAEEERRLRERIANPAQRKPPSLRSRWCSVTTRSAPRCTCIWR